MKFPIVELLDRYCIAQVKKEKLGNMAFEEFSFYEDQIKQAQIDLSSFNGHVEALTDIHRRIWALEDDFKRYRIDNAPLEEIGRKAIEVRDINAERYRVKERLAVIANETYKEVKSYGGERVLTFTEYHQNFDYTGLVDRIVRLYYPFDTAHQKADGQYRLREALHKINLNPGELLMLEDPFMHSFFPESLVATLNAFFDRTPYPVVFVTSNLAWHRHSIRMPVYADLFHEHSTRLAWPTPHLIDFLPRPHKASYTSTKDYPERRYVYKSLLETDNTGTVSLCASPGSYNWDSTTGNFDTKHRRYYSKDFYDECVSVKDLVMPQPLGTNSYFGSLPRSVMTDAYLGVITETFYNNDSDFIFFSEKVFNAIAHGQIFMYLGPMGSLTELRKFGYYTFDDIIDESYDGISDDEQRVRTFAKSMQQFLNRPLQDIHYDYLKVRTKIEHNQKLLYSRSFDSKMRAAVELALRAKP